MNLEALSFECRQNVLDLIMEGRAGHIGGDFSVMDILITLYFKQMNISPDNLDDPDRDLFVMSKGHSVEACGSSRSGQVLPRCFQEPADETRRRSDAAQARQLPAVGVPQAPSGGA